MELDPHETQKRLAKYAKNSDDELYFRALNEILPAFELPESNTECKVETLPIIYIVGAPRSGTTLLSQLLSRCLPVGYINNLSALFWSKPSVGIRISRAVLGSDYRKRISFKSKYGTTAGVEGPHEFGYFWRHWLKLDESKNHKLSKRHLGRLDRSGLKNALENEILKTFTMPVVIKNVICGFQAKYLTELHPASLFVHIKRDPCAVGASILNARMQRYGSYNSWWSLKPSTYPFVPQPKSPAEEVVRQIGGCISDFNSELSSPGVKSIEITYENLCANPAKAIKNVCRSICKMGYKIKPLESNLPKLYVSQEHSIPQCLESDLKNIISSTFTK